MRLAAPIGALLAAACAAPRTAPPPTPAGVPFEAAVIHLERDGDPPLKWEAADFLPYAFVTDGNGVGDPERPLFTDFVLLQKRSGLSTFDDDTAHVPANRRDWIASLDPLFNPRGTALAALDDLGRRTDTRFRVWVSVPYPSRRQLTWAHVNGVMLNFQNLSDRKRALVDFYKRALARSKMPGFTHARFAGFVWNSAALWETTGTHHWDETPDANGELNTNEDLVAWFHDELAREVIPLLWLPAHHRYVAVGDGPHRHRSPWSTHSETGEPLFDAIYMAPEPRARSEARMRQLIEKFIDTVTVHRLGMNLAPLPEDSRLRADPLRELRDRTRLDTAPAAFTFPAPKIMNSVVLDREKRWIYEAIVTIVERRRDARARLGTGR